MGVFHFLYRDQAPSVNGVRDFGFRVPKPGNPKPETYPSYWPGFPSGLGVFAGV